MMTGYQDHGRKRNNSRGDHPDFFRVTRMLSDIGARVNTGNNANAYGTMWCKGRYYGYANPNTDSFSTHMSPQTRDAKLAGLPRSQIYDLASRYGASVMAEDVESVEYDERTRYIHFNLRDGRVIQFMPDPMSDPDMHLTFYQDELDKTAEAMKGFDWNTTRWE